MKKFFLAAMLVVFTVAATGANAASDPKYKPFVLASKAAGDKAATVADVSAKLKSAGLDIVGTHSPYPSTTILVVTNDAMKMAAAKSKHGGFGAAQRVSITEHNGEVQVAYTNPRYMAGSYRMNTDLGFAADTMEKALGKVEEYGMKSGMDDDDLRDYHYMMGMEYFTDPHYLSRYKNYNDAIAAVEKGLAAGTMGVSKVYRIDLPGKDESLFGVALNGASDAVGQANDAYLMSEIDFKDVRSSAHLPYEILVAGKKVYSLSARFRIAQSFPDLSMMGYNSFMNIMDSPNDIKAALKAVAGDHWEKLD